MATINIDQSTYMEAGYLYIATGEKYIQEAVNSAKSLKRKGNKAPVALITDKPLESQAFDLVKVVEMEVDERIGWKTALVYRIKAMQFSPFSKTVFVDSDTYFCDDCSELFDLLDFYDLMACHDYYEKNIAHSGGRPFDAFPSMNAGVVVYRRNDATMRFLEKWAALYKSKIDEYWSDQPAFLDALLGSDVRLLVLQSIYNFRFRQNIGIHEGKKVKVIHGRLSQEGFEMLERRLNDATGQRAWIGSEWQCFGWETKKPSSYYIKKLVGSFLGK